LIEWPMNSVKADDTGLTPAVEPPGRRPYSTRRRLNLPDPIRRDGG